MAPIQTPAVKEPSLPVKLLTAGTAACVADLITFPLDTAKVRRILHNSRSISGRRCQNSIYERPSRTVPRRYRLLRPDVDARRPGCFLQGLHTIVLSHGQLEHLHVDYIRAAQEISSIGLIVKGEDRSN